MKAKIVFLGTPEFAISILEKLHEEHDIIVVITQPDRPTGREQILTAPPVKIRAEQLGIPVLQPQKAFDIRNGILKITTHPPDFLITAAYGEYLPKTVLTLPEKDALNVHPSLLPLYRGATPMQSALLNGDKKTGISIIRMVKEMDAGPIFAQEEFPLPADMKYPDLEKLCSQRGAELISHVLAHHDDITPVDQESSHATMCHKINKEDGLISWSEASAIQIYNKFRAFTPWPGAFTQFKDQKLSILDASALPNAESGHPPGTVFQENGQTLVQCQKGSLLIKVLQLAGKNAVDIKSFLNGHADFLGAKLINERR
ncbi:MAG: methionyl-tRNA formyltransferase [Candidatus Gracilibacteria bacterium]|nr:methionyl-tRNA formyltransferase [bacterium]MDZ4217246.1 methionyl-tRNA formyltransferase [Candidatus Gracilibacteria bacterium]